MVPTHHSFLWPTPVDIVSLLSHQTPDGEIQRPLEATATPDGLSSCTESLGFESSNETTSSVDDILDLTSTVEQPDRHQDDEPRSRKRPRRRWGSMAGSDIKFPPPLTSLDENGQPSFVLRPVRTDGRLELTEVPINRPEILRKTRENGRLRMRLVRCVDDQEAGEVERDAEVEGKQKEERRGLSIEDDKKDSRKEEDEEAKQKEETRGLSIEDDQEDSRKEEDEERGGGCCCGGGVRR